MKSYKELIVWQKSIILCTSLYKLTNQFPKSEIYGLTSQLRRAAVSIPSNIAEGQHRQYKNEFIQFLYIALGSTAELDSQLNIALNINYIKTDEYISVFNQLEEIKKMLSALIKQLKSSN
jgi:four helix bundle protein